MLVDIMLVKKESDCQASNRHSMMFLYQNEIYYESEHNQLTICIFISIITYTVVTMFAVLSAFYK